MKLIELTEQQLKIVKKNELDILVLVDKICKKHNIKYWLGYGTLLGCVRHRGFIPWDDDVDICIPREDFNRFRRVCNVELPDKYFYQSHYTDKNYYHLFDKIRINNTIFKESHLSNIEMHHGVFIDVFPIDNLANNNIKGKAQYLTCRILRVIIYSRFMNIEARRGKKRFAAIIIRCLFGFPSMDKLWKKAEKEASKYMNTPTKSIGCFFSPYGKKDFFPAFFFSKMIDETFENNKLQIPEEYDKVLSHLYGDYMTLPPKDKQKTIHDLVEVSV